MDIKTKEILCMKLLNFILQPTVYDDIRDVAREWDLEANMDKYLVICNCSLIATTAPNMTTHF